MVRDLWSIDTSFKFLFFFLLTLYVTLSGALTYRATHRTSMIFTALSKHKAYFSKYLGIFERVSKKWYKSSSHTGPQSHDVHVLVSWSPGTWRTWTPGTAGRADPRICWLCTRCWDTWAGAWTMATQSGHGTCNTAEHSQRQEYNYCLTSVEQHQAAT